MTDLDTRPFTGSAHVNQGGLGALTTALAEATARLEASAAKAGYRIAPGTADVSTETSHISEHRLTDVVPRIHANRTITITAIGLRADQIAMEATA